MRLRKEGDKNWVAVSDVMTGLMVIFMFIAISYIKEVKKEQKERDIIFEEFKATKEKLFSELEFEFKDDFKKWEVVLDKDLSIKFTNPDILFDLGEKSIKPEFRDVLDEFLPRYFGILLKQEYASRISEIRIEGHTDKAPDWRRDQDPYIANIKLSQERSAEVLKYFRNMPYYKSLGEGNDKKLQFWLTANGLSYGRTLDKDGNLTAHTNKEVNDQLSRRVEFRIITSAEEIIETVIKQME